MKGKKDMEKLDTAEKSVRKEMYCVLCSKGLKNRACMWRGMERNGEKEGGVGGWCNGTLQWEGGIIWSWREWERGWEGS